MATVLQHSENLPTLNTRFHITKNSINTKSTPTKLSLLSFFSWKLVAVILKISASWRSRIAEKAKATLWDRRILLKSTHYTYHYVFIIIDTSLLTQSELFISSYQFLLHLNIKLALKAYFEFVWKWEKSRKRNCVAKNRYNLIAMGKLRNTIFRWSN